MKKSLQLLVIILLTAAVVPEAFAYNFVSGGIYYDITGSSPNTVAVTYATGAYNSYSGTVNIPNEVTYDGTTYTVTAIGNNAFRNCNNLTGVTIPNTVTSIGEYAFYDCSNLPSITIPNGVESIGRASFSNCYSLSTFAFNADSCASMSTWSIFENTIIPYANNQLTTLTIGDNVRFIPDYAFSNLMGLDTVIIPNSVKTIGNYAFYNCTGLTSISIGNSVTDIGQFAFNGCANLKSLSIPSSVSTIDDFAFAKCTGLLSITVENGNLRFDSRNNCNAIVSTETNTLIYGCQNTVIPNTIETIGDYAFSECSTLNSMPPLPNSVKHIGKYSFNKCTGLTGTLIIPDHILTIGRNAFSECAGLTSVVIGRHVDTIGSDAFQFCGLTSVFFNADSCSFMGGYDEYGGYSHSFGAGAPTILTLTIGRNVKVIPDGAFYNFNALSSILIPDSVQRIGNSAFYSCSGITGMLIIPNSVTYIGDGAFSKCSGFTGQLIIPNSVTYIGDQAFSNCSGFSGQLSLSNHVVYIGARAFEKCGFIGTLTIPNTVTYIGEAAFSRSDISCVEFNADSCIQAKWPFDDCRKLKSLTIGNSVIILPDYVFSGCDSVTGTIHIPNSVVHIGNSAFAYCTGITGTLIIPDNVITIGTYAFENCVGIDTVIIGKSVQTMLLSFIDCGGLTSIMFNADSCTNIYQPFEGCDSLSSLNIGDNVKIIPDKIFYNCNGLTGKLIIPDSVVYIGKQAFYGCTGYDSLVIGRSVKTITCDGSNSAFYGCSQIKHVCFNADSCNSLGNNMYSAIFSSCDSISTLVIGENVKAIPNFAFSLRSGITGMLTIPNSVKYIGIASFASSGIDTVVIGKSVTTIASGNQWNMKASFEACNNLTTVFFYADYCNTTGNFSYPTFKDCNNLTSLIIGNNVMYIPSNAFSNCTGLASITSYNETPPVLDLSSTHPFNGVSRNTPVYVPCGSAQDYRNEWKYSTNNTSSYFNNIYETLLPYSFFFSSEDTLKGTVQITTMPSCTEPVIIEATPKFFYIFDHWSDGNTDNPRTLTLTQDTALVAYFREYAVMVASNDTTAGVVYMTGLPTSENPLATVEAVLLDSCYVFAGWSDGSTDNPHTISVTQDTLLSATFNSVVNLQITAPTTVCRGDSSTLIATGADRYLWFNGNTSSTIKILPDNSMVVTVTGTDNNGCSTSKGHHINVQSNPTLTFSGYTDICEGDSTIITAISSISINNILFENFADGVPSDWTIANNYLHTESLSGNHDKALVFPAYNLGHGFSDELIIPVQNLSIIQEPTLQFDVANSESVFYSGQESLSVFYSMDEGVTWNELYNKYGYSLATVSENTNQNFIPSDTQWRTETIDLTGVSGNVIIKFVFESDFYNYDHNNVWLDNIVLKPKINTQNVLLYEDFENPLSEEWGNIDTYGNGDAWLSSTHYSNDGIPAANRGEKCIVSVNQQNQCEHQLLTPTITIPTSGATLSYYINGYISSYAECIVYVVSNTQTEPLYFNFLMNSGWGKASVDLSAWAGEDIQIMFVHKWDYIVMLDDIMVLANDNYIWSDGSMSSQHSFSSSGTWQVTASDINGCHTTDSVTIAVWQPDTTEISINSPESFYVLNDEVFCQSGDYTQILQNTHGCDSVVNLHLTLAPQDTVVINDTICRGYRDVLVNAPAQYLEDYGITDPNLSDTVKVSSLHYYDENYNYISIEIDQNYWDTHDYYLLSQVKAFTNTYGCDSIVVYNKYMTFSDWIMIWDTVCGSYNWNGTTFTNSGEYYEVETYTNARGCTSSVNLTLTIFSSTYEELSANACESYTLNDITYTESGVYTQYTDTLLPIQREAYYNQWEDYWYYFDNYGNFHYSESETYIDTILGCKVITLNLTINHATASDTMATACDSFEWHGTSYTQSGDYPITLTNAAGCDSTVTLHLTVNYSTANDFSDTACDSYTWNDSTYTLSGNYTQTFTAANNCDSVVTLHLTINNSDHIDLTAVACGEYVWLDSTYTTSGSYSRTYTNMAGCDSIVTLHLTINPIPEVSITGNTTICPGGGTMLTATGADSYLWSNWSTNTSIPVNMFGVYSVTGTSAAGCTNTASVTVLVAQPPVITITGDLEICAGDTGIITAHGGNTYMWSNGSTDSSITVSSIGSWQVIGYDENGCNSMASATITVWQPANSQFSVTVNDSCYIWNTISYCESGNYTQTLQTVHGCDSVVTLHLTLTTTVYADVYETACNNYTWNNVTYNQSGDYTQTFSMANGSDSVVTLHLTLNPTYAVNDARTICASELPFIWNGVQFTEAGTQSVTLQTINDCDSVVTMTLMVNQSATGIDVQEACDSFEWIDGVTYTMSTDIPTYTIESGAANGCDSIVTLHLTINTPTAGDTTATVCESFDWYEYSNLTQSGDYTHTLTNAAGCDSIVTLHLTVNQPVATTSSATICDSELPYVWNGLTFNEAGTQSQTLQTVNGCDSVVTLTLTVNQSATGIDVQEACDSFEWIDGVTYTESNTSATYTLINAVGCDSIVTLYLTINESATSEFTIVTNESCYVWNGIEYCETGDYTQTLQSEDGCDSVVTLHLTIETGINDHNQNASLNVYPNPTSDIINVQLTMNNGHLNNVEIQVFDIYGKLLDIVEMRCTTSIQQTASPDAFNVANAHGLSIRTIQIDLSRYANGVYFIKSVSDGNVLEVRKVVKNR